MENVNSWNNTKIHINSVLRTSAHSGPQSVGIIGRLLEHHLLLPPSSDLAEKIKATIDEYESDYIHRFGPSLVTCIYNLLDDLKVLTDEGKSNSSKSIGSIKGKGSE